MSSRLVLRHPRTLSPAICLAFVSLLTPMAAAFAAPPASAVAPSPAPAVQAPAAVAASAPATPAAATDIPDLQPTEQYSKLERDCYRMLSTTHYNRTPLNDVMSVIIYNRYLTDLDGQHLYFLASDIDGFDRWKSVLDDQIKQGQLQPAFTIFNRAQQRMRERYEFVLNELDKNTTLLDFTGNDVLQIDRKDATWVKTRAELDQLWRLRLKSAALGLKLTGKKNDEILTTLKHRYKSQLTALGQNRPEDAFQAFMNAYAESYDPHTEYFSPSTAENFNINMSLKLNGIGATLQSDDEYTKIVNLIPGSPADKSHQLKPGDHIIGVAEGDKDFVDIVGKRIDEVVQLIRGAKGTIVRLQVTPASASGTAMPKVVSLTRNVITLEDHAASKRIIELKRNGVVQRIGVIKLPAFYADFQGMQNGTPNYRSTTRDVHKLLVELKTKHITGLILDLRNNGGGSLSEVNDLIGEFVSTGPTVQVKDTRGNTEVMAGNSPGVTYTGPLAVITNRLSASAAEIFAGAIQDYGRGLIVGGTTFGKGSVQSMRDLNSGQLKITEAKFYRISGASTQHKGVEPDIRFPELIDTKEIGESALPQAMPWDTIAPARYERLNDWKARLPDLDKASKARQAKNPDFRYLNDQLALIDQVKDQKTTPLNEAQRLKEKDALDQKQLQIENRRRAAKGQPLLKTSKEFEAEQEKMNPTQSPNFERPEEQAIVNETGEILLDSVFYKAPGKQPAKAAGKPAASKAAAAVTPVTAQ